jgi:hypothetical protein
MLSMYEYMYLYVRGYLRLIPSLQWDVALCKPVRSNISEKHVDNVVPR